MQHQTSADTLEQLETRLCKMTLSANGVVFGVQYKGRDSKFYAFVAHTDPNRYLQITLQDPTTAKVVAIGVSTNFKYKSTNKKWFKNGN